MVEQFSNKARTTLNGAIDNSQTSITVTSATGFPTSGDFRIVVVAEGGNTDEIMTVTAVSGTTWTVTRASESISGVQSASAHSSGATVSHVLTAGALNNIMSSTWTMWKNSSSQTLTNNTDTTITWESAGVDSGSSVIDLSNNRFIIPSDGKYLVIFSWGWETTVPGQYQMSIRKNAAHQWLMGRNPASASIQSFGTRDIVVPVEASTGDFITAVVMPGAVSGVTARGNAAQNLASNFALIKLGGASGVSQNAWQSFTPVWGSSGTQPGAHTVTGQYKYLDTKTIFVQIVVAVGAAGIGTGDYTIKLPSGFSLNTSFVSTCAAFYYDASTSNRYPCIWWGDSVDTAAGGLIIGSWGGNGKWTATAPVAPANGDRLYINGVVTLA